MRQGIAGYLYPSKLFVIKSHQEVSVRGYTAFNGVIRRIKERMEARKAFYNLLKAYVKVSLYVSKGVIIPYKKCKYPQKLYLIQMYLLSG